MLKKSLLCAFLVLTIGSTAAAFSACGKVSGDEAFGGDGTTPSAQSPG